MGAFAPIFYYKSGAVRSISELEIVSVLLGIPRTILSNRLIGLGWSVERAFTERGAVL